MKFVTQVSELTLEMEEDVGLVIFEHLGDKLNVHILDIDVLQIR